MKIKKRKHTRSSLNLYLVAGLYLLYIDYSLVSSWREIETHNKILAAMAAVVFAIFASVIIIYSLKGLKDMKQNQENTAEEVDEPQDEEII